MAISGRQDDRAVLGDRLRRARERRFVGRAHELRLVNGVLDTPEEHSSVLFVHGPGGVGKSSLLRAVERRARESGLPVARLDLRSIEAAPPAFCAALGRLIGRPADRVALGDLGADRRVLLLDTYEVAPALDGWIREQFLPAVPAGTIVVVAGRAKPAIGWSADEGWRDVLTVVPLRNLEPDEVRDLLSIEGVSESLHQHLIETSHGHPLAVTLLIDVWQQRGPDDDPAASLAASPDIVQSLLERFVAGVPGPQHRTALQISAHARTTTEGLLRATLGIADVRDIFDWLRGLSFIEEGAAGLFPHDLARDVLVTDARWRDPDADKRIQIAIHDWVVGRLADPASVAQELVADLVFLHRSNPAAARIWDWRSFGDVYADRLRPEDRAELLALTRTHESEESAGFVAHWLDRQPDAFTVFRGSGKSVVGFAATLALHRADPDDIAADQGTAAIWEWAGRHSPPRPGEEVFAARFFMDAQAHQAVPSRSMNALTVASTQSWLGRRHPSWEFTTWLDPDQGGSQVMAYIDFHRAPEADFVVGDRQHRVYAHDWRRTDVHAWLNSMGSRETSSSVEPPGPSEPAAAVLALSRAEFSAAVKQALRDLHRRDALLRNPLLTARVVVDRAELPPLQALSQSLRDAIAALPPYPRDLQLQRVLDRTYLRPASTQEGAAEVLDLPISTYRRHLARGVDRVADWLWQRELYGWPDHR
jgi:hypothetical protein